MGQPSHNPLVAKLESLTGLTPDEREVILELSADVRPVARYKSIIDEGDHPRHVHLLVEGWAARYKILPGGARQIIAFLIPGDFCDLHVTVLGDMDHGVVALTPARVAYVPHERMDELTIERLPLVRALWATTLLDEAVLRTWVVSLGKRDAYERVAHLMCELHMRLSNVGLVEADRFELPLTQETLADAVGLTPVHTNRVLQRLRGDGLIELQGGMLKVLDLTRLRAIAGFNPKTFHLRKGARRG